MVLVEAKADANHRGRHAERSAESPSICELIKAFSFSWLTSDIVEPRGWQMGRAWERTSISTMSGLTTKMFL